MTRVGNVLEVTYNVTLDAHSSQPSTLGTLDFYELSGFGRSLLPRHSDFGTSDHARLGITEKFIRLTKIA